MTEQPADATSGFLDRRSFVKKLAIGGFAIPAIVSFRLDSLARGGTFPNQSYGNQTYPERQFPGQSFPNQTYPNQTFPGPKIPWHR